MIVLTDVISAALAQGWDDDDIALLEDALCTEPEPQEVYNTILTIASRNNTYALGVLEAAIQWIEIK